MVSLLADIILSVISTWIMFVATMFVALLVFMKARAVNYHKLDEYAVAFSWTLFGLTFLLISVLDFPATTERAWLRFTVFHLILVHIFYNWGYGKACYRKIKNRLSKWI
jgi:hypothetical protein